MGQKITVDAKREVLRGFVISGKFDDGKSSGVIQAMLSFEEPYQTRICTRFRRYVCGIFQDDKIC